MVLEGLKNKILAYETIARARDMFFLPNIDTFQNRVLVVKSGHLVYKITKCVPNRDQFLLRFFYMIRAYDFFLFVFL